MTAADRIYDFLLSLARQDRPMPTVDVIVSRCRASPTIVTEAIRQLSVSGRMKVQRRNGGSQYFRRAVFDTGEATPWQEAPAKHKPGTKPFVEGCVTPKVTAQERAMIDAAVMAGRVTVVKSQYKSAMEKMP